jgi:NAD(P)-dependent dehydrogenase (short-subunit alcohol dehydrogenase family)
MIRSAADAVLDALIVPSFTKIGPAVRRRVFDWSEPEVAGRKIAITGPTSGLGEAAAERMAKGGADLVLLGRNPTKLDALTERLGAIGTGSIDTIVVDLADRQSVRDAGDQLGQLDRLDALVNNGGALTAERTETVDGLELTFATHVLAPFILTQRAIPALEQGDEPRVITVSSGGMYGNPISIRDLQTERNYSGTLAYSRAKRAQVDLTGEWAIRLAPKGISVHAMHPGWAATPGVSDALPGFEKVIGPLLRSPEEGADTIVWLTSASADEIGTDGFWLDRRRRPEAYLPNTRTTSARAAELWEAVADLA